MIGSVGQHKTVKDVLDSGGVANALKLDSVSLIGYS